MLDHKGDGRSSIYDDIPEIYLEVHTAPLQDLRQSFLINVRDKDRVTILKAKLPIKNARYAPFLNARTVICVDDFRILDFDGVTTLMVDALHLKELELSSLQTLLSATDDDSYEVSFKPPYRLQLVVSEGMG